MKKFLLSASLIAVFAVYALSRRSSLTAALPPQNSGFIQFSNPPSSAITDNLQPSASTFPVTQNGTPSKQPRLSPSSAAAPSPKIARFKDGSFTGNPIDAYYGTVQVQAVVQGGALADVKFLSYPQDRQHSIEVSNMSLPLLRQEAIQSQSANVDIVSGATETSSAFQQSLQSALDQSLAA
jgi:uncharacterized protein with FMN-binding domain